VETAKQAHPSFSMSASTKAMPINNGLWNPMAVLVANWIILANTCNSKTWEVTHLLLATRIQPTVTELLVQKTYTTRIVRFTRRRRHMFLMRS